MLSHSKSGLLGARALPESASSVYRTCSGHTDGEAKIAEPQIAQNEGLPKLCAPLLWRLPSVLLPQGLCTHSYDKLLLNFLFIL